MMKIIHCIVIMKILHMTILFFTDVINHSTGRAPTLLALALAEPIAKLSKPRKCFVVVVVVVVVVLFIHHIRINLTEIYRSCILDLGFRSCKDVCVWEFIS